MLLMPSKTHRDYFGSASARVTNAMALEYKGVPIPFHVLLHTGSAVSITELGT